MSRLPTILYATRFAATTFWCVLIVGVNVTILIVFSCRYIQCNYFGMPWRSMSRLYMSRQATYDFDDFDTLWHSISWLFCHIMTFVLTFHITILYVATSGVRVFMSWYSVSQLCVITFHVITFVNLYRSWHFSFTSHSSPVVARYGNNIQIFLKYYYRCNKNWIYLFTN